MSSSPTGTNRDDNVAASFDLNHEDLLIDTYTAGPNCAVRVVHLPTGLAGTSDQHKSLLEAKQEALTRLRERMETA